jgi:hypothetical protein
LPNALRKVVLSIPVGIGTLFFLASVILFSLARPPRGEQFQTIDQTIADVPVQTREVELVVISPTTFTGDSRYVQLELSEDVALAYRAILERLRERASGVWPAALPVPNVFMVQNTVVLDFDMPEPILVSIAQERALIQTIETTLLRSGATAVRFLVNQQEPETFLGHIVVNSSLD